ncbi:MAG: polyphosphate polymerase domain-containing protein [Bdellovibrionota bacterium]
MSNNEGGVSPLMFERYEIKYLIPYRLVDPISEYVKAYCDLDYFSEISPDSFYTINSLYFDSPMLTFYYNSDGVNPKRHNMRIRSYGDDPKPPYFFEVKEKSADFVKKSRAKVKTNNIQSVFEGTHNPEDVDKSSQKNLEKFLSFAQIYNVQPQVLTQYRRRAFLSNVEDYVRITFDVDLKCKEEREFNLWPKPREMYSYDSALVFDEGVTGESMAILELKCESRVPLWFLDLIRVFQLERGSFSKYGNSLERVTRLYL